MMMIKNRWKIRCHKIIPISPLYAKSYLPNSKNASYFLLICGICDENGQKSSSIDGCFKLILADLGCYLSWFKLILMGFKAEISSYSGHIRLRNIDICYLKWLFLCIFLSDKVDDGPRYFTIYEDWGWYLEQIILKICWKYMKIKMIKYLENIETYLIELFENIYKIIWYIFDKIICKYAGNICKIKSLVWRRLFLKIFINLSFKYFYIILEKSIQIISSIFKIPNFIQFRFL